MLYNEGGGVRRGWRVAARRTQVLMACKRDPYVQVLPPTLVFSASVVTTSVLPHVTGGGGYPLPLQLSGQQAATVELSHSCVAVSLVYTQTRRMMTRSNICCDPQKLHEERGGDERGASSLRCGVVWRRRVRCCVTTVDFRFVLGPP